MKQAVIYTRFSPRPNAAECLSIEFQLARCREYCEAHEMDAIADYRDAAISGRRADNRPGLQHAIAHVCKIKGGGGVLVVYALDRLARSVIDAIEISNLLNRNGADLCMITQNIDTSNAMGRAWFGMMAVLAQFEREQTGERTSAALRAKMARGERVGNEAIYGTRFDPANRDKVISDPRERRIIGMIRDMKRRGVSLRDICKALERNGIQPRGERWHHNTIARILKRHPI